MMRILYAHDILLHLSPTEWRTMSDVYHRLEEEHGEGFPLNLGWLYNNVDILEKADLIDKKFAKVTEGACKGRERQIVRLTHSGCRKLEEKDSLVTSSQTPLPA